MLLIQTCLTISSRKLKLIRFSYSKRLLYQLVLRERRDDTSRRVVLGSGGIHLVLQKVGLHENYFLQFQRLFHYFLFLSLVGCSVTEMKQRETSDHLSFVIIKFSELPEGAVIFQGQLISISSISPSSKTTFIVKCYCLHF